MTRYTWPRDFLKSPDGLLNRREFTFGLREPGEPFFDTTSLDQLHELMQLRTFPAQTWLPMGPSILLNGQATGSPMVAGRVRDLHVNSDGTRAYAGTGNGGVWYWQQSYGAWLPVGSWGLQPGLLTAGDRAKLSLTVGALLVRFGRTGSADDPTKDVVYVGTGELRPEVVASPGSKHSGIGVLRMSGQIGAIVDTPGGNPWTREANNLTGQGIFRLTYDPAHPPQTDETVSATLIAATSNGLFMRTGGFSADADWTEIDKSTLGFSANEQVIFTDAHWHASSGLWVTTVAQGGNDGLFRAPTGPSGGFTRVNLPKMYRASWNFGAWERHAISIPDGVNDRLYVLGKRTGRNAGHAALWRVDVAGSAAAAKLVDKVPRAVFTSEATGTASNVIIKSDQARYDMAITSVANATVAGRDKVYIGGSTQQPLGSTIWNASLFELEVRSDGSGGYQADFTESNNLSPGDDSTFIGTRIHADVHQLAMRTNGLWVACDGGVFRRESSGTVHALNVGLAVLEAGYLSNHPVLDGSIIAGLQDNAVIQRTGDTVWYRRTWGDGGGVGYHPSQPRKFFEQYTYGDWTFRLADDETSYGATDGDMSVPGFHADEKKRDRAFFYSRAGVAAGPTYTTGTPPRTVRSAQVCIGTDRLWYCPNWGDPGGTAQIEWVTIPSNRPTPGATRDTFEKIRVVRFAFAGTEHSYSDGSKGMTGAKILVLTAQHLRQFTYTAAATKAASSCTAIGDAKISGDHPKEKYAADDVASPFLDYLPRPSGLAWTDVAPHSGARGSCYVTTTGKTTTPSGGGAPSMVDRYDTLWWYDGEGRWYPTGLLTTPINPTAGTGGARASAHSVIVDPEGLPDFSDAGSMTDNSRFDFVYVGTRLGVWRGRLTFAANPAHAGDTSQPRWIPSWRWEPYFDGLPQAVVEDLAFHIEIRPQPSPPGGTKKFKLLRAAIVSRGVWELDLSPGADSVGRTFLRSYGVDSGRRPIDAFTKNPYTDRSINDQHADSPDIAAATRSRHDTVAARWATTSQPNEAEMASLNRTRRLERTSTAASPANVAYVMVHHRQIVPMDPSDITVHLFAWKKPPYPSATSIDPTPLQFLPLTAAMRTAILGTMQGTSTGMPSNLLHIGSANPTEKIEARMPRPVRFDFDLNYTFDGSRTSDTVILIAVVDSPANRLQADDLNHPNLVEVTRRTSLVAAARFLRG